VIYETPGWKVEIDREHTWGPCIIFSRLPRGRSAAAPPSRKMQFRWSIWRKDFAWFPNILAALIEELRRWQQDLRQ
jgi:hypothetical protein